MAKQGNMPRKSALWKDVRRSIARSKGRFVSILLLMALGSFALVGLFVAGPDMRATGEAYFDEYGLADLTVMSDYGLDKDDVAALNKTSGTTDIEYGYFKDVTLSGRTDAVRVMSMPDKVSQLELVDGRMPQNEGEIAIDSNVGEDYPVGSKVTIEEKPNALNDSCVLRDSEYTVVGHVHTPEIISIVNMGQSTAGTGSLKGYGVVVDSEFDSDVYMTARMAFEDTASLDPYSNAYRDAVAAHKSEVEGLVADRPAARLASVKADAQGQIDDGQASLDDARAQLDDAKSQLDDAASQLTDAKSQLDDAATQIAEAKGNLASTVAAAQAKLGDAKSRLDDAAPQLASARAQLESASGQIASGDAALADGQQRLAAAKEDLASNESALADAKSQLDVAWGSYNAKKSELDAGRAAYDQNWAQVSAQWGARRTRGRSSTRTATRSTRGSPSTRPSSPRTPATRPPRPNSPSSRRRSPRSTSSTSSSPPTRSSRRSALPTTRTRRPSPTPSPSSTPNRPTTTRMSPSSRPPEHRSPTPRHFLAARLPSSRRPRRPTPPGASPTSRASRPTTTGWILGAPASPSSRAAGPPPSRRSPPQSVSTPRARRSTPTARSPTRKNSPNTTTPCPTRCKRSRTARPTWPMPVPAWPSSRCPATRPTRAARPSAPRPTRPTIRSPKSWTRSPMSSRSFFISPQLS